MIVININSFTVFDSILKPEAPDVIRQLKEADIDCKIITGDSMLTAFYVASRCEFL
jgi:P-type E1-E2 ATPase